MATAIFDRRLYRKYDVAGPRYTSYPTAPHFHDRFDAAAYTEVARASNEVPIPRPLSLYVHIPFCYSLCYYCGCNKIVTRHPEKAETYLRYLQQEIALQAELFDADRELTQLHLGGGTPTYFTDSQLWRLMNTIDQAFTLAPRHRREFSIEIDPRAVRRATMPLLADIGFNRVSVGVQDFDPVVQRAINRVQSVDSVHDVVDQSRKAGIGSISLDLIYGLPHQSPRTFAHTLDEVLAIRPERLSVYNYAHLPDKIKAQRLIDSTALPDPEQKLSILGDTVERLTEAGYLTVGMDHFALPGSDLAEAMAENTLQRNFQGYSTHASCDLIAAGITGIGTIGSHYCQNHRGIKDYYAALDNGTLPVARGYTMSFDDRLRADVIERLMCRTWLDFAEIEHTYGIVFEAYFAAELADLNDLAADGLIALEPDGIRVMPEGRLLLRNVAMVFDRYLREQGAPVRYSRTV